MTTSRLEAVIGQPIRPCPHCRMQIIWSGKPTKLLCAWCGKPLDETAATQEP